MGEEGRQAGVVVAGGVGVVGEEPLGCVKLSVGSRGPGMVGRVQCWGGAWGGRGLGIGFGSWWPGTRSEHDLEKSFGARERRNWRLSSLST
jgi:hypothetical protein